MSRVRWVADEDEMERLVDEFIIRGYEIESSGQTSTRLRDQDWGDADTHAVVALLTLWWTLGLANVLYALYCRANADEVTIKIEGDTSEQ